MDEPGTVERGGAGEVVGGHGLDGGAEPIDGGVEGGADVGDGRIGRGVCRGCGAHAEERLPFGGERHGLTVDEAGEPLVGVGEVSECPELVVDGAGELGARVVVGDSGGHVGEDFVGESDEGAGAACHRVGRRGRSGRGRDWCGCLWCGPSGGGALAGDSAGCAAWPRGVLDGGLACGGGGTACGLGGLACGFACWFARGLSGGLLGHWRTSGAMIPRGRPRSRGRFGGAGWSGWLVCGGRRSSAGDYAMGPREGGSGVRGGVGSSQPFYWQGVTVCHPG